jgi:PH domain
MQFAEQEVLLQNANQEVLAVRQLELSYFSTFFNSFSVQAALLAGFVLNSLNDNEYDRFAGHQMADYVYWIFSAVLFAAALHCILTTVYCTVYGAGLALRGPIGSMVKAVDGMVAEQDGILVSFIICLLSFAMACLGYFWVIMTVEAAVISTFVMLIGLYYWSSHGLRIYNKFKWEDTGTSWADLSDDEETEPLLKFVKHTKVSDSKFHPTDVRTEVVTAPKVFKEGHLSRLDSVANMEYWTRKYFVLVETTLFYFDTQRDYELLPSKPSCRRPVRLGGYSLSIEMKKEPGFFLKLSPSERGDVRKVWDFKCDTLDELNEWSAAFSSSIM